MSAIIHNFRAWHPKVHFTGMLLNAIRDATTRRHGDEMIFRSHRQNAAHGAHQAIIEHDGQLYRLVLAPIDSPISIGGTPASEHFREI